MGAREGGDDFGQGTEVEVDQAADGVVVEEEVAIAGERAGSTPGTRAARGSPAAPATALVAADDGPLVRPAVVQEGPRDRDGGPGWAELGVEGQGVGPGDRPPVDDHPPPEIGGAAPLGVDPPAAADVLAQRGHHAQVGGQPSACSSGRPQPIITRSTPSRQGLVAQG